MVTIDAMGCQKENAIQIVEQDSDYVLTVKDKQPQFKETFRRALRKRTPATAM